jgi:drug/metabolite transporter (DMT)-like permease
MFQKYKYHLLMHLIIFIWGFTGILGKLIHLEALTLVWHRILIAFVSLFVFLFIMKKPMTIKNRKHLFQVLGVGILVALHWITFYISIQLSTASLGILCLSTATLHVTWMQPLIMKSKFSWIEFSLGLIVIYGIYIVSENFSPTDYEALIYGLISAICASGFNVFNEKLSKNVPSSSMTLNELGIGFIVLTGILFFQGKLEVSLFNMTLSDFLWLLFLGVLCTSVAFLLTIEIIKKLGAFTVSLSINLEPVYTMILAIFILNEHELLSVNFYYGSALIIVVVVANGIIKYYISNKSKHLPATTKDKNNEI